MTTTNYAIARAALGRHIAACLSCRKLLKGCDGTQAARDLICDSGKPLFDRAAEARRLEGAR